MGAPGQGTSRFLRWLIIAFLLLFGAHFAGLFQEVDSSGVRVPFWDQASHGLDAVHFARALKELDLERFLVQLHHSSLWPPVIPLVQAPVMVFFGDTFHVARATVLIFSVLALIAVYRVAERLYPRWGSLIGLGAALMLYLSPIFIQFSTIIMYEVPGIFFTMTALYLYYRYLDEPSTGNWRATCIACTILIFVKFNYGIMLTIPIMAHTYFRDRTFRNAILMGGRRLISDINIRAPFFIFVSVYTVCLVAIAALGGVELQLAGHSISITKVWGNPLYFLIVLILVRNYVLNRSLFNEYLNNIWNAPQPLNSAIRLIALPFAAWMSYPPFFKTFFWFLFNQNTRTKGFFSMETLTYHPGSFLRFHAPTPAIGVAVLAGVLVYLALWRRLSQKQRFLGGLCLFNLALVIAHPNYQTRYLLTTTPILFLMAASAPFLLLDTVLPKSLDGRKVLVLNTALAIVVCGLFGKFNPLRKDDLQRAIHARTGSEDCMEMISDICLYAQQKDENALLGFAGPVSPASIMWVCYGIFPQIERAQMPSLLRRFGYTDESDHEAILDGDKIEQIFIVQYNGEPDDYVTKDRQQYVLISQEIDQREDYVRLYDKTYSETGNRLRIYGNMKAAGSSSLLPGMHHWDDPPSANRICSKDRT